MAKKAKTAKKTASTKKVVTKPPLEPGMNVDRTPHEEPKEEKPIIRENAAAWTNRVFAKMVQTHTVALDMKGKRREVPLSEPRIILFVRGKSKSPAVWIEVKKFAEMFKGIIESDGTDIAKAEAIAADEKRGYAGFITHCKKKGLFK